MRFHDRFTLYNLKFDDDFVAGALRDEHLVLARLEPTLSARYEATLDLVFARDDRYLTIGFVLVEGAMLVERESSPFSWPLWTRSAVPHATLSNIEAHIEPWLMSLVLARFENDPQQRLFTQDASIVADIGRARTLGLFGATPLVDYLTSIAPAVYGNRFSAGRRAGVRGAAYANAAAYLCGRAAQVAYTSQNAHDDALVAKWYGGLRLEPFDPKTTYDLAIGDAHAPIVISADRGDVEVPIARPLPMATLVSFDADDSIRAGSFAVTVTTVAPLPPGGISEIAPVGGSAGRVALIVRDDYDRIPDADSDLVAALGQRLSAEGFSVEVLPGSAPIHPERIDLAHVVGKDHAHVVVPGLRRLRAAGVPVVVSPLADDPAGEGLWGSAVTPFAYRGSTDISMLELYLDGLARRRLVADGVPQPPTASGPVFDPAIAELLAMASCVHAVDAEEERIVRDAYRYAGEVILGAPLLEPRAAANPSAHAGVDDFILVHAPLDARTATIGLLRAARDSGLPTLFTGPVANSEIHYFFNMYAGGRVWYVPPSALAPGDLEGLYARARVYADVSWLGRGLNRFARAASYGAALLGSTSSVVRGLFTSAVVADPGTHADLLGALHKAWDIGASGRELRRSNADELLDSRAAFTAVVSAYDRASRALSVS